MKQEVKQNENMANDINENKLIKIFDVRSTIILARRTIITIAIQ